MGSKRTLGVVLFEGFELLDVFGPLEMFGLAGDAFEIRLISENGGMVTSRQGPRASTIRSNRLPPSTCCWCQAARHRRGEIRFCSIGSRSAPSGWACGFGVHGQCLAGQAGVLDGLRATSNKLAFAWASSQSEKVQWQQQARWVEDGKVFSSSGVSAGIDMALALIAKLVSQQAAEEAANVAEYDWHRDADWDPFAQLHGLVDDSFGAGARID